MCGQRRMLRMGGGCITRQQSCALLLAAHCKTCARRHSSSCFTRLLAACMQNHCLPACSLCAHCHLALHRVPEGHGTQVCSHAVEHVCAAAQQWNLPLRAALSSFAQLLQPLLHCLCLFFHPTAVDSPLRSSRSQLVMAQHPSVPWGREVGAAPLSTHACTHTCAAAVPAARMAAGRCGDIASSSSLPASSASVAAVVAMPNTRAPPAYTLALALYGGSSAERRQEASARESSSRMRSKASIPGDTRRRHGRRRLAVAFSKRTITLPQTHFGPG